MALIKLGASGIPLGAGVYGTVANDVHDMHKVMINITSPDATINGARILAHTPDQIQLQTQSTWTPRDGNAGNMLGSAMDARARVTGQGEGMSRVMQGAGSLGGMLTGYSTYTKLLTAPMWGGTQALETSISLEFHADSDPLREVWIPTYLCLAMATPYEWIQLGDSAVSMLRAPGPALLGELTPTLGGDQIEITVGGCLKFSQVIVTNATATVLSRYHKSGLPVATKVDIMFQSYFCITRQDLAKWFGLEAMAQQATALNTAMQFGQQKASNIMESLLQ